MYKNGKKLFENFHNSWYTYKKWLIKKTKKSYQNFSEEEKKKGEKKGLGQI